MTRETELLLEALRAHAEGCSRQQLHSDLRAKHWPHLRFAQLDAVLRRAGRAVIERDGRLFAADPPAEEPAAAERPALPRRFVAFDLESIVRPVVQEPYKEQHVFQVGAVRFGPDREWVHRGRFFNAYTALPSPDDELLIHRDEVRERYLEHKEPMAAVLERFRAFCRGAEVLVAYNGVAHDFPLLAKEYERARLEPLWDERARRGPRLVDGLYLAQALWPIPPRQHRLRQLLERLQVQVEDLVWHDALDDSKMLVALLRFGGRRFLPSLGDELVELLCAAGAGSDAWELLISLGHIEHEPRRYEGAEAAGVIAGALAARPGKAPLRVEVPQEETLEPAPVSLPAEIRAGDGTVDIGRLVRALVDGEPEVRAEQRQMVEQIRAWVGGGRPALVEAPTGTGKSYAILAAALDWLAADSRNKVVISTFTKQLQSQLAADIEKLTQRLMPQMAEIADMVKGAANRLSLRALVIAIAGLTEPEQPVRRRGRVDFSRDQRYRDLALYLLLRFIAEGTPTEQWEARSVDHVDVPGFFEDYCPRRLSLYLASLSQADASDYPSGRGDIARYTLGVREALTSHRLIVANHALLLAHLDDFADLGEHTLLFVDEAHELENAATQAIGPQFESGQLLRLADDAREWISGQPFSPQLAAAAEAVDALERYLDDERLQRSAIEAFATAEADPLGRAHLRTVTVASPLQGDAHVRPMEVFAAECRHASRFLGHLRLTLRAVPEPADPFESDRLLALRARVAECDDAVRDIVTDLDAVLGTPGGAGDSSDGWPALDGADSNGGSQPDGGDEVELDGERLLPVDEEPVQLGLELEEVDEEAPGGPTQDRSNRVVWAQELEELRPGRERLYRFQVASWPIELAREQRWAEFRQCFSRSYYVSATLRVANSWDFIRRRLGFGDEVEAIELASPFNAAEQAELVCFEDFPSWAEHEAQAMRTVAWQLSGYADALIDGGRNGAMVLTTARASAAGIFDWLARMRVERNAPYPLFSAGLEGNQRAVEAFKREGGVVVGTRGLWQGVDVAAPERLRLVWINKLPFASFADPVIAARREVERERAEAAGVEDPEGWANEHYYLPLGALALRQAVGRLIRTRRHRGVVLVSDRKLAGPTRLRRLYRRVFLGSLDPGLMRVDPETGEEWLGNVTTMQEGWRRVFAFFAEEGLLDRERATELSQDDRLTQFVELPETLAVLRAQFSVDEERELRAAGGEAFADALVERCTDIARQLNPERELAALKPKQVEALRALAHERDLLAVLPTGYGKSYCFQLPALALPGVTVVVSPLVSLMTDQALELNRTIGGRVRALVAPMRESNSRTGKSEVQQQLTGAADHGIKLVYLSPERLTQRQFQEWVRAGLERGIVRRVALDEAHTFVQWGDDFRPALRRAEMFLRQLKREHPQLRLLALTATANETVREGLRSAIFGLAPGGTRDDFAFVQANPLRPELALYRRVLPRHQGGAMSVAGLVERVADALDGHAIFYCLTVRQVDALYSHLGDYLQGHPVEVLRYHGRMSDTEKTAVANAFRGAPRAEEEGFRRMIVVATSAFGLGIDRPDIRAVFCVSPPTDLAALYQQLGRAGRDRAAAPELEGSFTAGLALVYPRANRTLTFMTAPRTSKQQLARIAALLLAAESPIDTRQLAEDLIAEDLEAGLLTADQAADQATLDGYQTQVVRVLAELSARGAVADLGDFPERVELRRGDYLPDTPELRELVDAVLAETPAGARVEIAPLWLRLRERFGGELPDPGALWCALLELHTLGYLDVSQRPNRRMLTAIEVTDRDFPAGLLDRLSRRQRQINEELTLLRGWFGDCACCQQGFQRYFGADALPPGTCGSEQNRCSVHWAHGGYPPGEQEPRLLEAFMSGDLRPAAATGSGRRRAEQQLDRLVWNLLWNNWRGLVENLILSVLRGDDHFYSRREGRRKPLWPALLISRGWARKPALQRDDLHASLTRLMAVSEVVRVGGYYRLQRHVERERARLAAEQAAAGGPEEERP